MSVQELCDAAARLAELCRKAGADAAEVLARDGAELEVKVRRGEVDLVKEAASKAAPKTAPKGEGRSESTSEPQAAKEPRKPRASRARKATKVETTETSGSPAEAPKVEAPQAEGPKVTTTTRAARKSTKAAAKKA